MSADQPVDLVSLARAARERLAGLVQQIDKIVRSCDPIELLAQLTLLYQTHPADKQPNRDESAEWQVRIEWLAWLVFAREMAAPLTPEIIDARILVPLEALLDDYFTAMSITLMEPAPGLSKEQDDIRSNLQIEALHVRGQGFQIQLERFAVELYSPHERYALSHQTIGLIDPPRRKVPKNLWDLLVAAEQTSTPGRTDAICAVLSWPDAGLIELSKGLEELRRKTILDGRAHAVAVKHPWKPTGITLACGFENREAIRETLLRGSVTQRQKTGSGEWAGLGVDLRAPEHPLVAYYNQAQRGRAEDRSE